MAIQILHIIDQYRIGGPGKTILNSNRYIDCHRFKIHIATFIPDSSQSTELGCGIKGQEIPVLWLQDKRGLSIKTLSILKRYINKHQIRILHCHGYKSEYYAFLLKLIYRNPIIVTTRHGWIDNSLTQRLLNRVTQLLSFLFDGVIVVSGKMLGKMSKRVQNLTTTQIIHNAIVLEDYKHTGTRKLIRNKYFISPGEVAVGVIGRLSHEKGCFDAIKALHHLKKCSVHLKLLFAGEGPLQQNLEDYVGELGISSQVRFIGHIHPVQPLFEAIDILVSPSYTEGISNVILEAMAFSKPVVATAVGGTPEIITHGENGLLVQPGAPQDIAKAIFQLLSDPEETVRMVERGYKILESKFEFNERMKKIQAFYEQVMTSK